MAARRDIDERLRFELQENVTSLQQPTRRLAQLKQQEHFARPEMATNQRFSQECFHAQGLTGNLTQEALKLLVSKTFSSDLWI